MKPTPDQLAKFVVNVLPLPNGCWLWLGPRSRGKGNTKWYGSIRVEPKRVLRAHVFAHDWLAGKECPRG